MISKHCIVSVLKQMRLEKKYSRFLTAVPVTRYGVFGDSRG
jgi:hypothetical protein